MFSGKHIKRTSLPSGAGLPGCSAQYIIVPLWKQPRICMVDWRGEVRQTLGADELGLREDARGVGVSSVFDERFSVWAYSPPDHEVHTYKVRIF